MREQARANGVLQRGYGNHHWY